jgi:uncharacterized protein YeaO (DUF488 family)
MIRVKHLFDARESGDGLRLWVGPVGLTRDLAEWCHVVRWLREGSPSAALAEWFEEHPGGWEYFRARHHDELARGGAVDRLRALGQHALTENVTLLHAEDSPVENAAVSLHQYLAELQAYCSDD